VILSKELFVGIVQMNKQISTICFNSTEW